MTEGILPYKREYRDEIPDSIIGKRVELLGKSARSIECFYHNDAKDWHAGNLMIKSTDGTIVGEFRITGKQAKFDAINSKVESLRAAGKVVRAVGIAERNPIDATKKQIVLESIELTEMDFPDNSIAKPTKGYRKTVRKRIIEAEELVEKAKENIVSLDLEKFIDITMPDQWYRNLALRIIKTYPEFRTWPAASKLHHSEFGGLLLHSVTTALRTMNLAYTDIMSGHVSLSEASFAALFHDIGKLGEYNADGSYVDSSRGHIAEGADYLVELFKDAVGAKTILETTKDQRWRRIANVIASHHGSKEQGATELPRTLTAMYVSMADAVDAAAFAAIEELDEATPGGVTQRSNKLASNRNKLYCTGWNFEE